MRIEEKGSSLLIYDIDEKPIKIPSQLYPLGSPLTVLSMMNTENFAENEDTTKVKEIFNSVQAGIGTCYTNTRNLIDKLTEAGFNPVSYVGWCFVGGAMPVHHCFTVLDTHVLDFFISPTIYTQNLPEKASLEESREHIANIHVELQSSPNSEKATFGKVDSHVLYVASPASPEKGLATYKKLLKAFPKHPCYTNIKNNTNPTQKRILEKQKESRTQAK